MRSSAEKLHSFSEVFSSCGEIKDLFEQPQGEVKRGPAVSMTQFGPTPMGSPSMPAVNVGGAAFEGEGTRIQIEGESGTGGRTVVDL